MDSEVRNTLSRSRLAACLLILSPFGASLFAEPQADAQTSAPEPELALRIAEKMRENLLRLPNYTCTETIERTRQAPGGGAILEDTLRLEVALVDNQEIFAWPGSTEFQDTDLKNLISSGTYGNGTFGVYAEMLFFGGGPSFEYQGRTEINGEAVLRYDFAVPRAVSRFNLTVNQLEAVVGFHGSLYADPETLDLRRLEIQADDIPTELGLLASSDSVDYQRVMISGEEFLLPASSHLSMETWDALNDNFVRFTGCRRFAGESTLVFVDPEFAEAAEAEQIEEVMLAAGLELHLVIETEIDLETSAIGDEVIATLEKEIKLNGVQMVPKNAVASGRIVRLDRHSDYFLLGIRFTDLHWPGGHARVTAYLDRVALSVVDFSRRQGPQIDTRQMEGYMFIRRPGLNRIRELLTLWKTL